MLIQDALPAHKVDDENLSFFKAIGVDYLTIDPAPLAASGQHAVPALKDPREMEDYFRKTRALVESHGMKLQNIVLTGPDEVTLALPGRDEKIAEWRDTLRAMGETGIPTVGYNFKPIGNFRTPATHGRGGAAYSTFVYDEFMKDVPSFPGKQIGEEQMWEHIEYFLERIVPVAEEAGVTLALHPDDPPIPEPMAGAARIVSSLDQYKRIFNLVPSPANSMLFCQGCVAEMGENVVEAIRDIGSLGKIAYVHFRNIRSLGQITNHQAGELRTTPLSFQEVFVDEGDQDMFQAMQAYKEVGFKGPFMMDHTPGIPGMTDSLRTYATGALVPDNPGMPDNPEAQKTKRVVIPDNRSGHAFAVGYIRAMIQAVYR
jgi:mannonate dehydratase